MRKLRMALEALEVETFDMGPDGPLYLHRKGTVAGHDDVESDDMSDSPLATSTQCPPNQFTEPVGCNSEQVCSVCDTQCKYHSVWTQNRFCQ